MKSLAEYWSAGSHSERDFENSSEAIRIFPATECSISVYTLRIIYSLIILSIQLTLLNHALESGIPLPLLSIFFCCKVIRRPPGLQRYGKNLLGKLTSLPSHSKSSQINFIELLDFPFWFLTICDTYQLQVAFCLLCTQICPLKSKQRKRDLRNQKISKMSIPKIRTDHSNVHNAVHVLSALTTTFKSKITRR